MMKLYTLLVVVLALPFVISCPPSQELYPCVCDSSSPGTAIICRGLENEQVLLDAAYALRNMKKFYSFTIEKSNFRFIPHDLFNDMKFQELHIISSSFRALTDTDVAFKGLEEDLASLVITNSSFLNLWDWTVLKNLKKLIKIHVDVDLNIISKDILSINSLKLKDISFAKNHLSYIHDTAFAGFKEVMSINLNENLISEVKRSMFPNPATMLSKLDFGRNEIQQFPSDMFENMPSLESLNVQSNKLLTISEKPFRTIWEQLRYFEAAENRLICDCRLSWMMELKFPEHMYASCDRPSNLKWKYVKELSEKDLWC